MVMENKKLANSLIFLSLDCVTEYCKELWITPTLSAWRLTRLRDQIRGFLQLKQFGGINFAMLCQVYHSLNANEAALWRQVWNWAESVYDYDGTDRRSECFWALTLAEYRSQDFVECGLSNHVRKRLIAIQDKMLEAGNIIGTRNDWQTNSLSEWDSMALEQMHIEVGFIGYHLAQMMNCNLFVKTWKSEGCFDVRELLELHEWGKKLAPKRNSREVDIPFPGSWEYGPIPDNM
jgi:hypothetical protein